MPGPNDTEAASERRGEDRRHDAAPYQGPERRAGDRRSGKDRRGAPRH